jgi:hypothetical protein
VLNSQSADNLVNYTATAYATSFITSSTSAPSKAPTKSSKKKASCFAGTELIRLQSGESKAIKDVVVGDQVLSYARGGSKYDSSSSSSSSSPVLEYSTVIAVPHERDNHIEADFMQLKLLSGKDIMLTPEHILMVSPNCRKTNSYDDSKLLMASQIQVGMCLHVASIDAHHESREDSLVIMGPVVEIIPTLAGVGVYTIVTNNEFIVVNDIIASPFAISHTVAHAYYNVFRFLYAYFPANEVVSVDRGIIASLLLLANSFFSLFLL